MPDLTIKIDSKIKGRLEKLARDMQRGEEQMVREALQSYVDLNEWQIRGIKQAIKEADAGDYASDRQIQATLRKWQKRSGSDGSVVPRKTSIPRPISSSRRGRKPLPALSRP